MPDQPDDPLHYEMKIPPEPKDTKENAERSQKDSGDAAGATHRSQPEEPTSEKPASSIPSE